MSIINYESEWTERPDPDALTGSDNWYCYSHDRDDLCHLQKLNLDDNKITDIANSGVGEATIEIPDGFVTVVGYDENDPSNNSVIFEFTTDQPMIINSSMVLIKTTSFGEVGTYGASEPRTITMTGEDAGTGHIIKIKLHYRELLSSTKGYKIALDPIKSTGTSNVRVSFDKNIVQPEVATNGGDLVLTYIKLDVL